MISYRFVPISSQKGVLFLRHPVYPAQASSFCTHYHGKVERTFVSFTNPSFIYILNDQFWLLAKEKISQIT